MTVVSIGWWHAQSLRRWALVSEKKPLFNASRRNGCDSYLFHGP